jgi:hypothetical protein
MFLGKKLLVNGSPDLAPSSVFPRKSVVNGNPDHALGSSMNLDLKLSSCLYHMFISLSYWDQSTATTVDGCRRVLLKWRIFSSLSSIFKWVANHTDSSWKPVLPFSAEICNFINESRAWHHLLNLDAYIHTHEGHPFIQETCRGSCLYYRFLELLPTPWFSTTWLASLSQGFHSWKVLYMKTTDIETAASSLSHILQR